MALAMMTAISLVVFGAWDYRQYDQIPAAEKEKLLPVWEAMEKRNQEAG